MVRGWDCIRRTPDKYSLHVCNLRDKRCASLSHSSSFSDTCLLLYQSLYMPVSLAMTVRVSLLMDVSVSLLMSASFSLLMSVSLSLSLLMSVSLTLLMSVFLSLLSVSLSLLMSLVAACGVTGVGRQESLLSLR